MADASSQESLPSQVGEDAGLSDVEAGVTANPSPGSARKPPKLGQSLQKRTGTTAAAAATTTTNDASAIAQQQYTPPPQAATDLGPYGRGRRIVPVHQSRIADRPAKVGEKDSSLKIKIELDLEVEVEIYARVKGDITIGLM